MKIKQRGRLSLSAGLLAFALALLVAASVAAYPTSALKPSGTVVAWGSDLYGDTTVPVGLDHVVAVAAGNTQSLALKSDGTVVAWGGNVTGQCNVPTGLDHVIAIAAGGTFSVALKDDGTVVTWGGFFDMTPPAGLDDAVAIAAGGSRAYAVRENGTVAAWGWDPYVPEGLTNVIAISAKDDHVLALKADGTVVAWGGNSQGETDVPAQLGGVTAISAGWYHGVALEADGTVVAWGFSLATSVPAGLSDVTAIAAGNQASLALKRDGTIVPWGYNWTGQLSVPADLDGVIAIALGDYHALAVQAAEDTTQPVVTAPTGWVSVPATSPAGVLISDFVSAVDDVDGHVPVTCGDMVSVFPISPPGEFAELQCWASDSAGNVGYADIFNIHVEGASEQLSDLIATVNAYNLTKLGTSLTDKLGTAQRMLDAGKPKQAVENLNALISQVESQTGKGLTTDQANQLTTYANRIKTVIGP